MITRKKTQETPIRTKTSTSTQGACFYSYRKYGYRATCRRKTDSALVLENMYKRRALTWSCRSPKTSCVFCFISINSIQAVVVFAHWQHNLWRWSPDSCKLQHMPILLYKTMHCHWVAEFNWSQEKQRDSGEIQTLRNLKDNKTVYTAAKQYISPASKLWCPFVSQKLLIFLLTAHRIQPHSSSW